MAAGDIVKGMHEAIKGALYSETGTGEFTTLLTSGSVVRIYDTVGQETAVDPFCVWTMEGSVVDVHFDGKERITTTLAVMVVSDYTLGVSNHLDILDALSALRKYNTSLIKLKLESIGEIVLQDQKLVSVTRFLAVKERTA